MIITLLWLVCLSVLVSCVCTASRRSASGSAGILFVRLVVSFAVLTAAQYVFFLVMGMGNPLSASRSGGLFALPFGDGTIEDFFDTVLLLLWQFLVCVAVGMVLRAAHFRSLTLATRSLSRRWRAGLGILFFLLVVLTAGSFYVMRWAESSLLINEVCSKNKTVLMDENGKYGDYVELYNPTPFAIRLNEYSLTDDLGKEPTWITGTSVIRAKGYALFWTNGEEPGFGIRAAGGETVYLLDDDGNIVDQVLMPEVPADAVYARDDSEFGWGIYYPSPLRENTEPAYPAEEDETASNAEGKDSSGQYETLTLLRFKKAASEKCGIMVNRSYS